MLDSKESNLVHATDHSLNLKDSSMLQTTANLVSVVTNPNSWGTREVLDDENL